MLRFSTQPVNNFVGSAPIYKKPVEIINFSYDEQRVLHMDDREMVFIVISYLFSHLLCVFGLYYCDGCR